MIELLHFHFQAFKIPKWGWVRHWVYIQSLELREGVWVRLEIGNWTAHSHKTEWEHPGSEEREKRQVLRMEPETLEMDKSKKGEGDRQRNWTGLFSRVEGKTRRGVPKVNWKKSILRRKKQSSSHVLLMDQVRMVEQEVKQWIWQRNGWQWLGICSKKQ